MESRKGKSVCFASKAVTVKWWPRFQVHFTRRNQAAKLWWYQLVKSPCKSILYAPPLWLHDHLTSFGLLFAFHTDTVGNKMHCVVNSNIVSIGSSNLYCKLVNLHESTFSRHEQCESITKTQSPPGTLAKKKKSKLHTALQSSGLNKGSWCPSLPSTILFQLPVTTFLAAYFNG